MNSHEKARIVFVSIEALLLVAVVLGVVIFDWLEKRKKRR